MRIHAILLIILLLIHSVFYTMGERKIRTISIPKCGTHIMMRLIDLILAPLPCSVIYIKNLAFLTEKEMNFPERLIPSHAICTLNNKDVLKHCKDFCSFIFVYRDPRDQVVSMAHWIIKNKNQWPQHSVLALNDLIALLIEDVRFIYNYQDMYAPEFTRIRTIADLYNLYLPWKELPGFYTTTFEKLVGPQGGGDEKLQHDEINAIARHIGITLTEDQIKNIADNLFGQSYSFREGKIGSWKMHFTLEHKELFKKHGGQLLIDLGYEKDKEW